MGTKSFRIHLQHLFPRRERMAVPMSTWVTQRISKSGSVDKTEFQISRTVTFSTPHPQITSRMGQDRNYKGGQGPKRRELRKGNMDLSSTCRGTFLVDIMVSPTPPRHIYTALCLTCF